MSQDDAVATGSRAFAESLVNEHLEGRYLPNAFWDAAVSIIEWRCKDGKALALDAALRRYLDCHAIAVKQRTLPQRSAEESDPATVFQQVAALLR